MILPQFREEDAFAHQVLSHLDVNRPFKPQAYLSEDGDCIEFLISNDDYYAERIDSFVTIYYSRHSNQIIGSIIKGIKKFLRQVLDKTPGFKIEFEGRKLKLHRLFTAHLWDFEALQDGKKSIKYQQLRDLAEECNVEIDIGELYCTA